MKDIVTPVPQEEVKAVIHRCLEQAALVNYQRLSEYAKLEGKSLLPHINMFKVQHLSSWFPIMRRFSVKDVTF